MQTLTDLEVLLAAIVEAPEDDFPRIAYADALLERGEASDADRAQFIRAQLEIARRYQYLQATCEKTGRIVWGLEGGNADKWVKRCRCPVCRLFRAEWKSSCRYKGEWEGVLTVDLLLDWARAVAEESRNRLDGGIPEPVPPPPGAVSFKWRRGFPWSATLTCDQWMKHGKGIASQAPLTEVRLSDKRPWETASNAWSWWLSREPTARIVGEMHRLPREIHDVFASGRVGYPTKEKAIDALSAACLKWARPTV